MRERQSYTACSRDGAKYWYASEDGGQEKESDAHNNARQNGCQDSVTHRPSFAAPDEARDQRSYKRQPEQKDRQDEHPGHCA